MTDNSFKKTKRDAYLPYLHTMYSQTRSSVQLFMTNVALEVFRLLMLNEYFFIIEVSVAVPFEISVK